MQPANRPTEEWAGGQEKNSCPSQANFLSLGKPIKQIPIACIGIKYLFAEVRL